MNKISYKLLKKLATCEEMLQWFLENFGEKEYKVDQFLSKIKADNIDVSTKYIVWLMIRCEFARTPEMLKLFMESEPDEKDISWFVERVPKLAPQINTLMEAV
jgi:hypothetical protein